MIKIGFDIGGVLSKYPDILRPIGRNRNSRTEEKLRQKDLQFLERLNSAKTLEELMEIDRNHLHKSVPAWKRVAIHRALLRIMETE